MITDILSNHGHKMVCAVGDTDLNAIDAVPLSNFTVRRETAYANDRAV